LAHTLDMKSRGKAYTSYAYADLRSFFAVNRRVTQRSVATALGVTEGAVSRWVRREREPSLSAALAMADRLDINPKGLRRQS